MDSPLKANLMRVWETSQMPFCEDYLSPKPSQSLAGVRILRAELEQAARQKVYRHISRDARKPCLFCRTVRERRKEGRREEGPKPSRVPGVCHEKRE